MALDSSGNVYVGDICRQSIQIFDNKGTLIRSIGGSFGSGNYQFNEPRGVAVDANGIIYVADSGNQRVQVFDNSGNFIRSMSNINANDVAVDASGNLYVGAANGIQVFDNTGTYVRTIGTGANGVAVDTSGNIYAASGGNGVYIYNNAGTLIKTIGISGDHNNVSGVAVDASGNVYVSDIGWGEVMIFDNNGILVKSIEYGVNIAPVGVALDANGNIYVGDTNIFNPGVRVFDKTGTFLTSIASPDVGQFSIPDGVAVASNGNFYVADSKLHVFDNKGKLLEIGNLRSVDGFGGVAVDTNGSIYVTDIWNLQVFDDQGIFVRSIAMPGYEPEAVGVAVDGIGNIYVTDSRIDEATVRVFDTSGTLLRSIGSYGSDVGQLDNPWGVAVDSSGNVYVADCHNYRIQKFDASGNSITAWGGQGSGDGQFDIPTGVAVDKNGNVYVVDVNNNRIEVFDTEGNYKGQWGSYGPGDGQFIEPWGVATNDSGTIVYVADMQNDRIEAFVGYGTPSYTVNFIPGAHGSVSGTASQTVTSGGNATAVTAVPDSGYRFVNWTGDNGFVATTDNPLTLTDVTASHTITANFAANPPLTTTATVNGTAGANSWYVSDVGISFSAPEAKKICTKLDNRAESVTAGIAASMSITSGGSHTVVYYAVDSAGNEETPQTLKINIDMTPPAIRIAGVTNGAVFALGRTVPTMRYAVTDRFSGVASKDAALTGGNANNAGIFTYTVNAMDNAGNTATKTVTYSVHYLFRGLLPASGKKFTAGSAVPVTFQLKDAKGNFISTASATLMLKSPSGAPVTPASSTNTGNAFQYDSVTNRYIYNLNTVGLAAGRWQLQVMLDDGSRAKTTSIKLE